MSKLGNIVVAGLAGLLAASMLAGADLDLQVTFDLQVPKGFPRPAIPADNPMNAAKVELGRYLFYDKRMSVNGKESCATCHRQELAFTDGREHAEGTTGQQHPRNSMSLVNVAYVSVLTWANPTLSALEEQALGPMLGTEPIELGLKGREQELLAAVRGDAVYQKLFPQAFAGESELVTFPNVTKAIAAFERSIISMRSPYDRYRYDGDQSALSAAAKRGELIFSSSERGGCFQCHGGWAFSSIRYEGSRRGPMEGEGGSFFNTGVSDYAAPNRGLFEYTQRPQDVGKFRAPSLRNIALTAPYMHDGSMATLEDVVEHYAAGGHVSHANKSRILKPFELKGTDESDLIEFLRSLTDEAMVKDTRWSDPWPKSARAR